MIIDTDQYPEKTVFWIGGKQLELITDSQTPYDSVSLFEEIINYLYDLLIERNEELQSPLTRKLVLIFLHYMYFYHLGVKE